jgi:hypothetical protein
MVCVGSAIITITGITGTIGERPTLLTSERGEAAYRLIVSKEERSKRAEMMRAPIRRPCV